MIVETYSNVSRPPPVCVVDVRVQKKSKADDELSFAHHNGQIRLGYQKKGRGEVLTRDPFSGNGPRHKDQDST